MDKKIIIFGCKYTTKYIIDNIPGIQNIITIPPDKGKKFEVADYCDLTKYTNTPIYQSTKYSLKSQIDIEYINNLNADIAIVVGWQRLIPNKILEHLTVGAFGMHGSCMDLPLGRGRSPMNWSIIEGRKHYYANLFKYSAGADDGEILDCIKFNITDNDTGETMHYKQTMAMKTLLQNNMPQLILDNAIYKTQRNITPTYYPKRSPSDSLIDWSTDIYTLQRFIRAVTKPFNGAYTYVNGNKLIIYNAQILDTIYFGYEKASIGEVVEVFSNGKFVIKVEGGLLLINEYKGQIKKGEVLNNGSELIHYFELNKYGYYDVE
jgi:methionyl-tRNA formyltransferase